MCERIHEMGEMNQSRADHLMRRIEACLPKCEEIIRLRNKDRWENELPQHQRTMREAIRELHHLHNLGCYIGAYHLVPLA